MDNIIKFVPPERRILDLPNAKMGRQLAVVRELAKLTKPEVQRYQEIITEIDNIHEGIDHWELRHVCAECHTHWPCATHRAIYNETEETCVHRL